MDERIQALQVALKNLGFDPGKIDGVFGPNTKRATKLLSEASLETIQGQMNSGLVRIIWHWTVGTHQASGYERDHYHYLIEGDGGIVRGVFTPEDNINCNDGRYAAHTRNCNTGSIGIAVCGMLGAKERPLSVGEYPVTAEQIVTLLNLSAVLGRKYGIPISPLTMLNHGEVEANLGIPQAGKWDIGWLPSMTAASAAEAGDVLRKNLVKGDYCHVPTAV